MADLEELLGYHFKDPSLLTTALTHRSFVNEHELEGIQHNESMEFLGDSVLGFLVSSRIYQRYPKLNEGTLSKFKAYLVSAVNLFHMAEKIELGSFIRLSRGEEKTGGRAKRAILVDTYEAIIGALYLDGGIEAALRFVDSQIVELLDSPDFECAIFGDFKSTLQETLHDRGEPEPLYKVVDEIGPDHRKVFVVQVMVRGAVIAEGSGRTKKEAQQEAARLALEFLRLPGSAPEA